MFWRMGESSSASKTKWRSGRSFQRFRAEQQDLFPSRGQDSAAACVPSGGVPVSGPRHSHGAAGKSKVERVRRRADLCHGFGCFGASLKEVFKTPSSTSAGRVREQRQLRERFVGLGCSSEKAEKALARRWYDWRKKFRKSKGQVQIPFVDRRPSEEGKQFKRSGGAGGFAEQRTEVFRSPTNSTGHADCRPSGKESSASKAQQRKSFKRIKQLEVKPELQQGQTPSTRTCQSDRDLSCFKAPYEKAAIEACQTVCPGDRRRAGSGRRKTVQPARHWTQSAVGKTKIVAEDPLYPIRSPDAPPEEEVRAGDIADHVGSQSHSSDCHRPRRLEPQLVADSSSQRLGSQTMGRVGRRAGKRGSLSEINGGAQQICREGQKCSSTVGRSDCRVDRGSKERSKGKVERERQEWQGRGEDGELKCSLHSHSCSPDAKLSGSNSIVEALKSGHGSFSRFLKILHEEPFISGSGPRTSSNINQKINTIFPSLLVVPRRCTSKSSRRRSRARGREYTWEHVRMLWSFFTFLEGGSPYRHEDQVSLAYRAHANPWSSMHQDYAGFLHEQVLAYDRLECTDALGRGLEQLEKLVSIIKNSSYKPGPHNIITENISSAMDVRPNRMSLPECAGIIDPSDFLKGQHLKDFTDIQNVVPHDISPEPPTKGCFKVRPDEVREVYTRLLESGVATLIPEEMALRDESGRIVSGGLFAVPHKAETDRIICDRRPQNELERRLVWAKLPHGALLTQLIVPKGFSVRGSGDDLSNYFYLLKHREEWLHRNAVGPTITGAGFEKFGFDPKKNYILSFVVIPMGDLNAVDIAQQTHLEILRDCGTMSPSEVIAYRSPLPASTCLEGLYIDDHITIQIVPSRKLRRASSVSSFRDDVINAASRGQYAKLGIPISQKKQFTKEYHFQAWGTEVDSQSGRVGTPLKKLKQLESLLIQVCFLPKVSQKLLQRTLGLIVHPCMHQRHIMCLLQEAYFHVDKLATGEPRRLPKVVREELLTLALVLPLCHSNIRWPVSCRIGASDASLGGGGRAVTLTKDSVAQTLYRFGVHRGESVRLDWEKGALAPPSTMIAAPTELEDLMMEHTWNTTHKCKFGHRQHINILEMKMVKAELTDLVMKDHSPARHVLLVDSRVCAGAWSKGRSSSKQLNRVLRQMLGWALVGRKSLHLIWVQSAKNPADHPSRGVKIPEPPKNKPTASKIFGSELHKFEKRLSNRKIAEIAKKKLNEGYYHSCKPIKHVSLAENHPAVRDWSFREIFSGKGCLSKVFKDRGLFFLEPPVELFQHGRPSEEHDVLNNATFSRLIQDAKKPRQIWHFGMPCSSFSLLQNMNKGTRNASQPEGDGSLDRENRGNELARRTCYLCLILISCGNFFTIENPKTSWAWHLSCIESLKIHSGVTEVTLDQCCYGLRIPDELGKLGPAKKGTKLLGNLPFLSLLHRQCKCQQPHVQVIGGVKLQKGWVKRSELAGAYPKALCSQYHRCCEKMFA